MTCSKRTYDSSLLIAGTWIAAIFLLASFCTDTACAQPGNPFGLSKRARQINRNVGFDDSGGSTADIIIGHQQGTKEKLQQAAQPPGLSPQQLQAAGLLPAFANPETLLRRPATVLKALADREAARKQPAAKDPKPKDPAAVAAKNAADFQFEFVTGDWPAIGQRLAKLPPAVGPFVYGHLLTILGSDPQLVLLPDEFLPLVDAAPAALTEMHLTALAQLLRRINAQTSRPDSLIDKIERGSKRLGGEDPQKRLAAAQLLVAAGMLEQAGRFLPPLESVLKDGDAKTLNMYALFQAAVGELKSDDEAYQRAWQMTLLSLESKSATAETNRAALDRAMTLIPNIPGDSVSGWLRDLFRQRPAAGLRLLAVVGNRVTTASAPMPRLAALQSQQRVVNELLTVTDPDSSNWTLPLQMLIGGWINEAQKVVGNRNGNRTNNGNDGSSQLPPDRLLATAPSAEWCHRLNADVCWHVRLLTGRLAAQAGDKKQTFAAIQAFLPRDKANAQELAGRFLRNWVQRQTGQYQQNQWDSMHSGGFGMSARQLQIMQMQQMGMWGGGRSISEEAIPLTRAKQARRIADLAELLGEIKEVGVTDIDDALAVTAFDACHSPAEIYVEDDIQKVFGPSQQFPASTALSLVAKMRSKLAGQWRMPEIQQQSRTRRTDKELVAEITRGYELAANLANAAVERFPQDIKLTLAMATLLFDQAEFLYGQKVDLKTYIALRDKAFGTYRQAAEQYVAALPTIEPQQQSINVFRQWFQSSLGSSDLAYLTRQDVPERDQIEQIAATLATLEGETAERHRRLFGEMLTASMDQVPAHLKPWYLREGLRLLGDHPSGDRARRRLAYYDDLLTEIVLHMEVDGRAEVGHGQPFGVRLSIRNTTAVGRERGGFADLLGQSYSMSSGSEYDPRKKMEAELREKLSEAFEIDVVRFHDVTVTPRRFGRTGWRETPLAYLVLRAKDPAVDRLPTVSMDLEFSDGSGAVMLPIESQVVLIDAHEDNPSPRPTEKLVIQQTLDARPLHDEQRRALLEVTATSTGLPADLGHLLNIDKAAVAGFRIVNVEDHGLDVTALDETGENVQPLCRRTWSLELEPVAEQLPAQFVFPATVATAATRKYEKYDDADIVETASTTPLAAGNFVLATNQWIWIAVAVAGLFVLAVGTFIVVRRRRRSEDPAAAKFRRPDKLTPFTLMLLLESIREDETVQLDNAEQESLNSTIGDLERSYFHRNHNGENGINLETVFDNWYERASVR